MSASGPPLKRPTAPLARLKHCVEVLLRKPLQVKLPRLDNLRGTVRPALSVTVVDLPAYRDHIRDHQANACWVGCQAHAQRCPSGRRAYADTCGSRKLQPISKSTRYRETAYHWWRMNSGSGGVLAEHNPATMQPELTEPVVPITLRTLDCRSGSFARFTSSKAPIGWEVVQLVGLQTLDLAILVRVQASQPNHFNYLAISPSALERNWGASRAQLVSIAASN